MKNFSAIYELIYLVILMAAGAVGLSMLMDYNLVYEYERYTDKSLAEVNYDLGIVPNPNVLNSNGGYKELFSIEVSDTYISLDEIIAMFYVQDDTCPINEYGYMKLRFDGVNRDITDKWSASKYTYLINVYNKLYPYNAHADIGAYLVWNEVEHAWCYNWRYYIPAGYDSYGLPVYEEDGRVSLGEI